MSPEAGSADQLQGVARDGIGSQVLTGNDLGVEDVVRVEVIQAGDEFETLAEAEQAVAVPGEAQFDGPLIVILMTVQPRNVGRRHIQIVELVDVEL